MKRRFMTLIKSSVCGILIFCLLQISACGVQESADSGAAGKIMHGIRSEVKAIWGKKESLTNNEISVNTMSVDEEETERIFDAYGIEEAVYILEEGYIGEVFREKLQKE